MTKHRAACSYALAGLLLASTLDASGHATAEDPAPAAPLPYLQTAIVEYRWVFLVPEWIVEARNVDLRVHGPALVPRRVDYAFVEWTTERRKIARVAEFHCKYSDFGLPNECRTTWRDAYADVPVPVLRRDYIEVDVPQWSAQDLHAVVDVPRLVWREASLVVSLPAVTSVAAPPSMTSSTVPEEPQ